MCALVVLQAKSTIVFLGAMRCNSTAGRGVDARPSHRLRGGEALASLHGKRDRCAVACTAMLGAHTRLFVHSRQRTVGAELPHPHSTVTYTAPRTCAIATPSGPVLLIKE